VKNTQLGYKHYSLQHYNFIGLNCSHEHYFVVTVGFDINSTNIFDNVKVYDSIRHSGRNKRINNDYNKRTEAASFLKKIHFFGNLRVQRK
jgi:hypothetical protein